MRSLNEGQEKRGLVCVGFMVLVLVLAEPEGIRESDDWMF